ncbi:MAG: hypothetical protein R3C56_23130 [Pirellulaceae bacterium]
MQQTKSEIRSLAAEIAQLASAALDPGEFYHGFLPRLCAAMGAKAAAVWRMAGSDSGLQLVAGHSLPSVTRYHASLDARLRATSRPRYRVDDRRVHFDGASDSAESAA